MKKLFLAFAASVMAFSVSAAELNIYASGLKSGEVADGKVKISYVLNAPATALEVQVLDAEGAIAKTIAIADEALLAKGAHADVEIDLAGLAGGTYHWALKASAAATEALVEVTDESKGIYNFYLPQGLDVDASPESPFFGRIYVGEASGGVEYGDGGTDRANATTQGIFIYDQLLEDVTNQGTTGYAGGVAWVTTNRNSPKRLSVAENGELFIGDYSDANSGVYVMDPANPSADFRSVLDQSKRGTEYTGIMALDVVGDGDERVLYTLTCEDGIYKRVIGDATTPYVGAAELLFSVADQNVVNYDVCLAADGRGGFWMSQNRAQLDVYPALMHVNANGERDYVVRTISGEATPESAVHGTSFARGNMALNVNKTLLAHGQNGTAVVFSISYDETTGVPTLTKLYATPIIGNNVDGLAFDWADNLYGVSASKERLYAFATPKADNTCVTPAAKQYTLSVAGESTGIDNASLESVKVRKVIENGQVVIIKDGVRYNVLGAQIM